MLLEVERAWGLSPGDTANMEPAAVGRLLAWLRLDLERRAYESANKDWIGHLHKGARKLEPPDLDKVPDWMTEVFGP